MFNSDGQVVTVVVLVACATSAERGSCSLVCHMHMGDLMIVMTASNGMTRMNRL